MEKNLYWEHTLINNIAERYGVSERYGTSMVFELDGPGKTWPESNTRQKPNLNWHFFYSSLFLLYVLIISVFSSSSSGKNK